MVGGQQITYFHAHNYMEVDNKKVINLDLQPTKWWVA